MSSSPPPASPPPTQVSFYIFPHSPTPLHFPPSANYTEWRGRCFCCCKTDHTAAACHNSLKCGKCWSDGHVRNSCKGKMLNLLALPYWANRVSEHQQPPKTTQPRSFDDLLQKPYPLAGPTMPASRPKCLTFYAEQDPAMREELSRLTRAVVFDTHGIELGFSLED